MKGLHRGRRPRRDLVATGGYDRFPSASQGRLRIPARDDPTTGLIAWADFSATLADVVAEAVGAGHTVGLAVGDVDDLKNYVERTKASDAESFGHLAGNALMARLGMMSRSWMFERGPEHACLATFGGDEIIVLAHATDDDVFIAGIRELRDTLSAALRCAAPCRSLARS